MYFLCQVIPNIEPKSDQMSTTTLFHEESKMSSLSLTKKICSW